MSGWQQGRQLPVGWLLRCPVVAANIAATIDYSALTGVRETGNDTDSAIAKVALCGGQVSGVRQDCLSTVTGTGRSSSC